MCDMSNCTLARWWFLRIPSSFIFGSSFPALWRQSSGLSGLFFCNSGPMNGLLPLLLHYIMLSDQLLQPKLTQHWMRSRWHPRSPSFAFVWTSTAQQATSIASSVFPRLTAPTVLYLRRWNIFSATVLTTHLNANKCGQRTLPLCASCSSALWMSSWTPRTSFLLPCASLMCVFDSLFCVSLFLIQLSLIMSFHVIIIVMWFRYQSLSFA